MDPRSPSQVITFHSKSKASSTIYYSPLIGPIPSECDRLKRRGGDHAKTPDTVAINILHTGRQRRTTQKGNLARARVPMREPSTKMAAVATSLELILLKAVDYRKLG
ncbi:hypothetical protein JTE90_020068 [Oedothorax gibbosus]|uniref:Uncharacterized protein n=1 Tax=Oedothorax gibbosus TaxID=931172 RepID=A0AAV6USK9_9ARAC|nr:hypothetical protein JTE90_020068 [Oedothorax gibbosus]